VDIRDQVAEAGVGLFRQGKWAVGELMFCVMLCLSGRNGELVSPVMPAQRSVQ
jgi:hypothetical protein